MTDPLAALFQEFLRERIYLHNVTPRTQEWYETTWKAFVAVPFTPVDSDPLAAPGTLSKARLQAFVVRQRERGISARSVN